MRVRMILPALTEATSPFFRPIKYSLFPPLGLATLAAYLRPDDDAVLVDEHVHTLDTDDAPDLVVIQVYITSARRAYQIADLYRARGAHVALGGLHVTSLPDEAAPHADAVFLGPGEQTFPQFLADVRVGRAARVYRSTAGRTLERLPPIRRDLIDRARYLVPNSIVVTRGCPQHCDFCYKDAFFQGAATVDSILRGDLIERAAEAGLRSLFVGFETLTPGNLARSGKRQNLGRDYSAVAARLHSLGIMINGSFVFGMDDDDGDVFRRTVDWAIEQGITTATFHIQTPYPGTGLAARLEAQRRITTRDWDLYDTRHVVYQPARLSPEALKRGYDWAYREFYRWSSIGRAAWAHGSRKHQAKHFFYAAGWKKFERAWNVVIRARQLGLMTPLLEAVLSKVPSWHNAPHDRHQPSASAALDPGSRPRAEDRASPLRAIAGAAARARDQPHRDQGFGCEAID